MTGRLDLAAMQQAATHLVGTHDFSAFQSTGSDVAHAVRTVTLAEHRRCHRTARRAPLPAGARPAGDCWPSRSPPTVSCDTWSGRMAGTLVEVGQGRRDPDLRPLLASANRALAGPTAPAHGLWLVEVNY